MSQNFGPMEQVPFWDLDYPDKVSSIAPLMKEHGLTTCRRSWTRGRRMK